MEQQSDLIAALATPEAVSAISLVRLSGKGASATVEKLMKLKPGRLTGRKRVVGDLAGIDYLVAISWPCGKSYTGEEMVDLMCHGSPGTARRILEELERNGARLAVAGEFTRRAWMNGRLTSLDVLTLYAKYKEETGAGAGVRSDLSSELSELTSEIEGLIEFSEDHEVSEEEQIAFLLKRTLSRTQALAIKVKSAEVLPRVFLMGPVNAGKSTLFNKLYGEETVLVSSIPGTTRDGATRTISISGRNVEISDSPGSGGETLDGKALELAVGSLKNSDRIVWMDPLCASPSVALSGSRQILTVCSLSDRRETEVIEGWLPVSSITGQGIEKVIEFITATEIESPSWRLERMADLLQEAIFASESQDIALAAEIVSEILREAEEPERCGEAVERALERFCVGK
ncbi:MAG: 50S ribosome-binding GTPase [Candidatus Sabulitectum sp.]|nr:50S ribosome-binding GTPase [Candidatus Sabulitectum sp.]